MIIVNRGTTVGQQQNSLKPSKISVIHLESNERGSVQKNTNTLIIVGRENTSLDHSMILSENQIQLKILEHEECEYQQENYNPNGAGSVSQRYKLIDHSNYRKAH